jgi:hypothetical protein
MSTINRREALRSLLTGALQTAGAVVLACSALPAVAACGNEEPPAEGDLQERADRLASEEGAEPEDPGSDCGRFRRGGFANGGGGFRRGGFGNGGGGFRRGGFANGGGYGGGGFRRGGFGNGGYGGGGFRNAGFRNW